MCTSIAVGFYIEGMEEYQEFKGKIKAMDKMDNSIFSVYDVKPIQIVNQQKKEEIYKDEEFDDEFVVL